MNNIFSIMYKQSEKPCVFFSYKNYVYRLLSVVNKNENKKWNEWKFSRYFLQTRAIFFIE